MSGDTQAIPIPEPSSQPIQSEQTPEPVLPPQPSESENSESRRSDETPEVGTPTQASEQTIPTSSAIELSKSDTDQSPPETTIAQSGGLSEIPDAPTNVGEGLQSPQTETPPNEPTSITESLQQQTPETQERVVEKTIEKIVPRELNEEEKATLYRTRLKTLSTKGNESRTNKRRAAHEKILAYLREHGFAINNEIQKLCGIGDSTATRCLKDLEQQGLILKIGRTRNIRWRLRQGIP